MSIARRLHRAEARLAARHPATAADDVWPAIIAALDAGEADAAAAADDHPEWLAFRDAWQDFVAAAEAWRARGALPPLDFHPQVGHRQRVLL
jgi:hypothetical protein